MKTIEIKLYQARSGSLVNHCSFAAKLLLLVASCFFANLKVAAADGSFAAPYLINGSWGVTNVDNSTAVPSGSLTVGGNAQIRPVWFKFTAPSDGEVTFDTLGSLTPEGHPLDTIAAIFGGSSFNNLYQLAANDEIYPAQKNSYNQSFYTNGSPGLPPNPPFGNFQYNDNVSSSFAGPSILRFNAKANTAYYVVVDARAVGMVSLNWAFKPSGVFRFASEISDQRGLTDTNGNPFLLVPQAEGQIALVTVTRVAGSYGRCSVRYSVTNLPASIVNVASGFLTNSDIPAVSGTHFIGKTGLLTFDDYEMSKTISVPLIAVPDSANRDILVALSEPQNSSGEAAASISAPRVDPVYGQIVVRSLNMQVIPSRYSDINTNPPPNMWVYTNWSGQNSTFNFSATHFIAKRAQNANQSYPLLVRIQRGGTPRSSTNAATILYVVNPDVNLNPGFVENVGVNFPLSPGSDYAVPDPANAGNVYATTPDFTVPGGYSGTITFAANDNAAQYIPITVYPTTNANFAKDFQIQLYALDNSSPQKKIRVGMVDSTVVTILFDDQHPPAGSVDQLFNADFNLDYTDTNIYSFPANNPYPGTDGQVYGVATYNASGGSLTPNYQSVIVGEFYSFNGTPRNCIARLNGNGTLDTTFDPGVGIGAVPGFNFPPEYIYTVVMDSTVPQFRCYIGGSFSSFNGVARGNIARLNANGSVDTTFNPGSGANGPVYAISQRLDGKLMIGGSFTAYNGVAITNLARINPNGSLDTTFNPGGALKGPVYTLGQQIVTLDINRTAAGGQLEDTNFISNLPSTSGLLTIDYDFFFVPDRMKVFYGDTNAILIYDTTVTNGFGHLVIPFGPVGGFVTNAVTIVMNQGNGNPGTAWIYQAALSYTAGDKVYVGGEFTGAGGVFNQDNIARFFGDGSFDYAFDSNKGINGPVYSLAVQTNGSVIYGGEFSTANNLKYNRLIRLDSTGAVDTAFQSGIGPDSTVYSIDLQNDGTFYLGGSFLNVNGTRRAGFARMNSDGTVDTSFLDTAFNQFAGLARERYSDYIGAVYSSAVHPDGGVVIGGSFDQVGGGQVNINVRPTAYTNAITTANSRDGVRIRSNVARLVGGASAGPGNIGFLNNSYSATKTASSMFVSLLRTNGNLGYASANFSVVPQLAQPGVDYAYTGMSPTFGIHWNYFGVRDFAPNPFTRMHGDGLFGNNFYLTSITGHLFVDPKAQFYLTLLNNTASSGDLSAKLQLANPANADQFYLGGQNIPLGVALGASLVPMNVVDNQQVSGTIGFSATNYTGIVGNVTIPVVRSNGVYGRVSVQYSTVVAGSTAIVNSDYVPTSGILNFQNGVVSNGFFVNVRQSNYVSSVEKYVNLQLTSLQAPANAVASYGISNAVLRIINQNFQGFLVFSASNYLSPLSQSNAYITVNRVVGSKGSLSVKVVTSNGSATNQVDYLGLTNMLVWNNGDVSSRSLSIPLLNDGTIGSPSRVFNLSLLNPTVNGSNTPSLLGSISNAVVTITNDNYLGIFSFSKPKYIVNENGGQVVLTVNRTGTTAGTADINYQTFNGAAIAGVNFEGQTNTLTFNPGDVSQLIVIPIYNDGVTNNLAPADFNFSVQLVNGSVGTLPGQFVNAEVNIVDSSAFNYTPGSPDLTFNADPGADGPVYALAEQSDGSLIAAGNFGFVNGYPENNIARINPDGTTDSSGFFYGLSGPNAAIYSVVNQTDDRLLVGGKFTAINGVVRNRLARLMLDGTLDTGFNPGSGADDTVYSLAETFLAGSRKIYVGGAFQSLGVSTKPFLARLNNSGTIDPSFNTGFGPNGTVYAVAVYPTNSPYAGKVLIGGAFTNYNNFPAAYIARLNSDGSLDTNFMAGFAADAPVRAIVIQNDGGFVLGGDFTNVFDAFGNYFSPHVARVYDDLGSASVDGIFAGNLGSGPNGRVNSLFIQADNGILVAGEFTQANGITRNGVTRLNYADGSQDPTINFGSGANAAVYASLVQSDDQRIVLGGAFTQFNGSPHNRLVRLNGGSVTGAGAFEFTSASYQALENGVNALITIRRIGGTTGTNTVVFSTSDATAFDGVNYHGLTNTVIFPEGEVQKTVAVPLIHDGISTPDLTVNLSLSDASGYGDQTNAVLTILNVDSSISFSSPNYFVSRNVLTGTAQIDVVRSGTNSISSVVFATTTNGTAVPLADYTPTNITLNFNLGESVKSVFLPILTGGSSIGDRTVFLTLTNIINASYADPSNAVLTIHGTNQPGTFAMLSNALVVVEGNTNLAVTVIRTNGSGGVASVQYGTIPGSAVPGINYVSTTGSLTFGDGETSRNITIPLLENNLVQGPVSFTVQLGSVNGATLSTATQTVVTVLDNDAGIFFANATNNCPENQGFANINVLRVYNTAGTASVYYRTADGTGTNAAHAGINYQSTTGTLSFTNGETTKSISVPLINNTNVTGDLLFGMSLSNSVGAQIISPSNTVVVIQDADAGVSFVTNNVSVLKNAGTAIITVVCSNPRVEPVVVTTNDIPLSVNYYTLDGTAKNGIDYQSTSGTIVFTNGIVTNTFTIPIYNNSLVNGNHTFTVVLTNVTAPGQITPYRTQSVVIVDSNSGLRFSQSAYSVFENGVLANINVYRTGYTDSVVSVDYIVTNGTAVSGVNFTATNGTLVFTNGDTVKSFNVPIIANSQVQPNLSVLMQLVNPTNGYLVSPSAATLTILEENGSYVIPAGAQIVSESGAGAPNGILDSNETVTVLFGFRDSAGLNVTNLVANLLATNGVLAPSPSSQNYSNLTVYGHSVSRPFTFVVNGTNSLPIAPTFKLYDNAKFIGNASFSFTVGAWTRVFSNATTIVINDNTNASPYPSVINVSNIGVSLVKATVTLNRLTHTYPADVDALVMSPSGTNTLIMANAGSGFSVTNVILTFDDATNFPSLPQASRLTTGTNKPTGYFPVLPFP